MNHPGMRRRYSGADIVEVFAPHPPSSAHAPPARDSRTAEDAAQRLAAAAAKRARRAAKTKR